MRLKKLQIITIFFVGLLAITITLLNWKAFKGIVKGQTPAAGDLIVYNDSLQSNFVNWSWNSDVNLSAGNPVYQGNGSVGFTPRAWGGLYFHSETPIDLTQYSNLHFAALPNQQGQNINLIFYDTNNQAIKVTLPLSKYISSPSLNTWNVYTVPVGDILPAATQIKGFAFQEFTGNSQPAIYFDDIRFTVKTQSTAKYTIYNDSLQSGWTNWSWDSKIDLNNSFPVFVGDNSISFTPTAAWGGLYLHSDAGIDTAGYTAVTFAAKASQDNQKFAVLLYDNNNQPIHDPLALENYTGQPVTSTWKSYTIPLTDFNANNKVVKGFAINDLTGHSQSAVYLDEIALISQTENVPAPSITAPPQQITPSNIPSINPSVTQTPSPSAGTSVPAPTAAVQASTPVNNSGNPLAGITLFNNPDSNPAATQAEQWRSSKPADAAMMDKIAGQPKGMWMGGWSGDIRSAVQTIVSKATSANAMPVFIAYNIPNRDCGSYSAGGVSNSQAYQDWINGFAAGIGSNRAVIILEPDALAQMTCLPSEGQQQRIDMLKYAVQKFKSLGGTAVYLDAAHSGWIAAGDMATRLKQAGIDTADGFSLNVSNFDTTATSVDYGQQISSQAGGKHFVIDTSRNGNGPAPDSAWCNPAGRALGEKPTTQTGNALIDGFLWLKYPGESDGSCNGGPSAGTWYPEYALGLAQQAKW